MKIRLLEVRVGVVDVAIDHFRISTPCQWQRASFYKDSLKDIRDPKKTRLKKCVFSKKKYWKTNVHCQAGLCNMYPLDSPQLETWNAWWICGRFKFFAFPSGVWRENCLPSPEAFDPMACLVPPCVTMKMLPKICSKSDIPKNKI